MNLFITKEALSAVAIVAVLTGPAFAQQLPQYEVAGFPISRSLGPEANSRSPIN
jgi:hypothetical protein